MVANNTRSSLELLYNVSRELASALDLRTVLQRVLFQSLKYVGGERGSIVVLDDNGKTLDAAIVYGQKVHEHTTQQLRETIERGLAGWVIRHRKPARVDDTSRDERWLRRPDDAVERSGAKSALSVPLLIRERLVGVLTLVHPQTAAYSREHLELMQAIADQAAIAVLNARLYAESQRQARVMTALASSGAAISASLRLGEVLDRILKEVMDALEVETVALALVEANGDLLFHAAAGRAAEGVVGKRVPAGRGLVGWVQRRGEGAIIPSVGEDTRFLPEVEQFEGLEPQAVACAPLFAQGKVVGVLEAINPVSGVFDPDALLVLAGIGNLAGSTIQNARLFERLQAAHKRYRELFDDSIDPILITNWDGKILEANRQALVLSEYQHDELGRMTISELQAEMRTDQQTCLQRLRAGQTCTYEAVLKARSGRRIPVQVSVRRVMIEEGESLQWILRDITERKDLDALREDLTSMIYHDLRSPLANIVSSLDMLTSMFPGEENESVQSILRIATRSTDRIQRLISSLLDINRLEAGHPIVSQQAVSPASLIAEVTEMIRPMAESRQQTLATHLPDGLPSIWVDVDMIRRVLLNLLENAMKFTPFGGKIEIGAARRGNEVQIWVQDSGPGIAEADQERIFEKYTRLKAGEDGVSGLGLGLAFCRLAVNGHGGRIWVESKAGQGAKFLLTLPLVKR
ncbi:MAG: GAF domain-containing protein [Anaerolineales bacterium]